MIQPIKLQCLLMLLLPMAGCKTSNIRDRQEKQLAEQHGLEANQPPESTETHRNIARAMFPNAPEKRHSAECFRTLTPKISMQAVVEKCGRPDEEVGSGGVFIFVWHMPGGSSVSISTPTLERIGDVKYTNESDSSSSLLHGRWPSPWWLRQEIDPLRRDAGTFLAEVGERTRILVSTRTSARRTLRPVRELFLILVSVAFLFNGTHLYAAYLTYDPCDLLFKQRQNETETAPALTTETPRRGPFPARDGAEAMGKQIHRDQPP